jgi:uncharacterized protein YmfQ (DUF2313 family)
MMATPTYTTADFTRALLALLPRGRAWPRDPDTTLAALAEGLAGRFQHVTDEAALILSDTFPATASTGFAVQWERTLGLPGPYGTTPPDLAGRRLQIVAALTDTGGQSAAYFIALAARLGYTITIEMFRPTFVDDLVDSVIRGVSWAFHWEVHLPAGSDITVLQAVFEQFAPAHTTFTIIED